MVIISPHLAELSAADRQLLESWLVKFDQSWQEGQLPAAVRELPPPGNRLRLPALLELVKIDLERQWQRGQHLQVEDYLKALPELASPETAPPDLIYAEYEVRRQFGASPDLADFAHRFPHQVDQLQRLIDEGRQEDSSAEIVRSKRETDSPHSQTPSGPRVPPNPSRLPEQFGRYRILEQLGRGGMGTVYLAYDSQLERRVALKVPHFAENNPEVLERFHREARAAATLEHPNLCPVYDVGAIEGIHYLTMAFIDGNSLVNFTANGKLLSQRAAASVVRKLALALEEAHARGVVHRDLKPSNIMINQRNEPVVMDFGLARLVTRDAARLTLSGAPFGTPAYMPPEQVNGNLKAMGPHSDVYSLGVILFEMLTGKLPFEGSVAEVLGQILAQEPQRPSLHRPDLDPRLEAVCLKAMAKRAEDRYATMAELAAALDEYLHIDAPVAGTGTFLPAGNSPANQLAAAPEAGQKAPLAPGWRSGDGGRGRLPRLKWLAAAGAVAALLTGVIRRAARRQPACVAAGAVGVLFAGVILYVATDHGTIKIELSDPTAQVEVKVDGQNATIMGLGEPLCLRAGKHQLEITGKDFETVAESFTVKRGNNPILRVTLQPKPLPKREGLVLAAADSLRRDQIPPYELKVAGRGNPQHAPQELVAILGNSRMHHWGIVTAVAFSPDRKTLASGSTDNTVRVWDITTGEQLNAFHEHTSEVCTVTFSPNGETLASGSSDGFIYLREMGTGKTRLFSPRGGRCWQVAFSLDGKFIAAGLDDGTARIWNVATGKELHSLPNHKSAVWSVAFHPKGEILATASWDGNIRIWNTNTGTSLHQFKGHEGGAFAVAFSPDGKQLASGGRDGTRKLWDAATWEVQGTPLGGHERGDCGGAWQVAFSPDGKFVVSSAHWGKVFVCDGASGILRRPLPRLNWTWALAISPDNRTLAIGNWDSAVRLWDRAEDEPRPLFAGAMNTLFCLAISPKGGTLASGSADNKVRLWHMASGKESRVLDGHRARVLRVAFAPDGQTLASGDMDGKIRIWDLATGVVGDIDGHAGEIRRIVFSPDGKTLASVSADTTMKLWEVGTRNLKATVKTHGRDVTSAAYSPDGKVLASAGSDKKIRLCEVETGKERPLGEHTDQIWSLTFSPDGKILASGGDDQIVKLWNLSTGEARSLDVLTRPRCVAFSPDGLTIATTGLDGKVRLWSARSGMERDILTLGPSGGEIWDVVFTPDGRHLVTANRNGTIYVMRIWGPPPGPRETKGLQSEFDIDFNKLKGGNRFFPTGKNAWGLYALVAGEYQIRAESPVSALWSGPGEEVNQIGDYVCEVDGRLVEGADGSWGLAFSHIKEYHFEALVRESGRARQICLRYSQPGRDREEIAPWTDAPSLGSITKPNKLRLEVTGGRVRVFANGVYVLEREDNRLRPGWFHLLLAGYKPPADARFKNFRLWRM